MKSLLDERKEVLRHTTTTRDLVTVTACILARYEPSMEVMVIDHGAYSYVNDKPADPTPTGRTRVLMDTRGMSEADVIRRAVKYADEWIAYVRAWAEKHSPADFAVHVES